MPKKKVEKKEKITPNKKYYVLADRRPHSERFNVTIDKLEEILERMQNGLVS